MMLSKDLLYRYILITSARNEEAYIGGTIESILHQEILPQKWVIISDGSTDDTDIIIRKYAEDYTFIDFLRRDEQKNRDFASKACALNTAYERIEGVDYEFIGILDADITVNPDYYRTIMDKYYENPNLGIAGGYIKEKVHGKWKNRPMNSILSVSGAIQFFRRECYERMGGLQPLKTGGEDWIGEIHVRMQGYEIRAYPGIPVFHHKPSGAASGGWLMAHYKRGEMDYTVGSHPLFEVVKCTRRIREKPYFFGALARLCGFLKSTICRGKRLVSQEVITFLRTEQMQRLGLNRQPQGRSSSREV